MTMWVCPLCNRSFKHTNQVHSCNDTVLADFLVHKPPAVVALFWHFVSVYESIGRVEVQPAKSMIAIAAAKRIAYITRIGKSCIDIVFPFTQPYYDNLCFHKIAQVPGQQQFNHHFKMCNEEDVNEEVQQFMQLAYTSGNT